ncbi:MAG: FAD-dependent oxidoreductase [Bacillota bacterium]|nr:FAD-dependent oxidoreductase [Bacillota bacterium]
MRNTNKPYINEKGGVSVFENPNREIRPIIQKLAKHLSGRFPQKLGIKKITVDDPEYYGLAALLSDEMAEIALKMNVRDPKTIEELKEITNKPIDVLEPLLQEMANIGIIEYNWENPSHTKQYVLPPFVPGSAEFMNMKKEQLEKHPELASMFERMAFLPIKNFAPSIPMGGAGIGMHVIPVEKAIELTNESIDIEHISYWLDKYEGKYAKSPCSCRYSRSVLGEGCADDPENWCIGIGDMAQYLVETNKGEYVTKEEVLDILEQAEKNGFVHQITNIDGKDKIFAICNCNVKVCNALRTSQLFNTPNMSRSAYVAHVDKNKCVACGRCVEYCPAGAVKLGQKLCQKNGQEITYPKQELPDATKWGPEKWNVDYRDTNRINCYETGTSPCKSACPAHIAVQGYLKMASQGCYQEALALIKKENPFPAVCGRICNHRCEDACTRGTIDQAIAIDDVKKFIAQLDLDSQNRYIPEKVIPSTRGEFKNKIAIIGAGPAGLSCAYFLALTGYRPTVFEKNNKPGGMLRYGIPSFKLEKEVIDAEIEIIQSLGVEIRCGIEVGKDITLNELRAQGYQAFYLAIGCQGARKLNVQGEECQGVMSAIDFLKKVQESPNYQISGISVVVGGGNVAIDVARTSIRSGSETVQVFSLESKEEMPASQEEVEEALLEGVYIHNGWGPKEILVENGKVKGILLKRCVRVKDSSGKFAPQYDETDTKVIYCDHIFFSIGQCSVYKELLKEENVQFGRGGSIIADSLTYQTGQEDIFVGGDVYTGPSFAIEAIAAGKEGAESIHRFVHENASMTIGRNRRIFIGLDTNNISVSSYDNSARQIPKKDTTFNSVKSFKDPNLTLTEEQVKIETSRCLSCGASIVDENKCIGCGICTTKCEFDAIHLSRDLPKASHMIPCEDTTKAVVPNILSRGVKIIRNKGK